MDENEVVDAICTHLEKNGHRITSRLLASQQGIDVVAEHLSSGRQVYVEAKGGTSSRQESARFGEAYSGPQVFDRVAKGVFTVLKLRAEHPDRNGADVLLAVPHEKLFLKHISSIFGFLCDAGIGVLLVRNDGEVSVFEG